MWLNVRIGNKSLRCRYWRTKICSSGNSLDRVRRDRLGVPYVVAVVVDVILETFCNQCSYLYKTLPMDGFEPRTPGVGTDRSTKWATTTARIFALLPKSYFKGPFPASFSLFLSLLQTVNNCSIKIDDDWIRTRVLSSGIGSDHAVNCATTTT